LGFSELVLKNYAMHMLQDVSGIL